MSTPLTIRDWEPADMEKLAEFHNRMGIGYSLPDNFGPLYCIRKVVVDSNNNPVAFAAVKLVGESFIWLDPMATIPTRAKGLGMLHEECRNQAVSIGLEEVSCWIPDKVAAFFAKVIESLGWKQSPWKNWTYLLK